MIQMHPAHSPVADLAAATTTRFFAQDEPEYRGGKMRAIKYALRRSSFGMSGALEEIESIENAFIMLAVDQFEELFRYASKRKGMEGGRGNAKARRSTAICRDPARREPGPCAQRLRSLTMRSDFIVDCAGFPGLPEAEAPRIF